MDGAALLHLGIVNNEGENKKRDTLLKIVDYTSTAFGKRMMKKWVCNPLTCKKEIEERLESVADFLEQTMLVKELKSEMKELGDLERMIMRLHSSPSLLSYSLFFSILESLEKIGSLFTHTLSPSQLSSLFRSPYLLKRLRLGGEGGIDNFVPLLSLFKYHKVIDQDNKKKGKIVGMKPALGIHLEYDQIEEEKKKYEEELEEYLNQVKSFFKNQSIKFSTLANCQNLIEVPVKSIKKKLPDGFELVKSMKQVNRYKSKTAQSILQNISHLNQKLSLIQQQLLQQASSLFDSHHNTWVFLFT